MVQAAKSISDGKSRGHKWTNVDAIDIEEAETLREKHRLTGRMPVKKALRLKQELKKFITTCGIYEMKNYIGD